MNHPASPTHRHFGRPRSSGPIWTALAIMMMLAPVLEVRGAYVENPDLGDATVSVLLYLDDQSYCWTDVPARGNFTALCATLEASAQSGTPLNYSTSQYGAYVTSLFGASAPADFSWWWELLLWNGTALAWQEAPVGASDLLLAPWSSIAWCPNSSAPPLPDPLTRYPSPKFRGDLGNTGQVLLSLPAGLSMDGIVGFPNGPVDTTPAVAHGRIFVSTGGVYNWTTMTYELPPGLYSYPSPGPQSIYQASYRQQTTAAGWQVSSPALGGGDVVIGTSDGKVLAFRMEDLEPVWNFSIGPSATGVTSSPVIFQDRVYIAGGDGGLHALSLDGKQLWNLSLGGPAYMSTPAISDGRLFVGSDGGVLTCAALDGTLLWNFTSGGKIRSSAAVSGGFVFFENTVYDGFTAVASTLFCVRADDGSMVWNSTVPPATSSPAVGGGRIYLGTNTGVVSYDLAGNPVWSYTTPGPIQSSPILAGDVIVVTENKPYGAVRELAASDGEGLAVYMPSAQYLFSSPVYTGDRLLFASDDGNIYYYNLLRGPDVDAVSWSVPKGISPGKKTEAKITVTNEGDTVAHDLNLVLMGDRDRPVDGGLNVSYLAPGHNFTAVFNWTPAEGYNLLTLLIHEPSVADFQPEFYWHIRFPAEKKNPVEPYYISISLLMLTAIAITVMLRKKGGGRKR